MHNNIQDNQQFIDAARERGEDTFMYMDPKSGECLLVSGSAACIKLLGEIVDDYEMLFAVVAAIDTELLERWRRESSEQQDVLNGLQPTNGENEHA
jgi:hypothetical protein